MKVIGHTNQLDLLTKLLANDSVPHALLFSGPAGIGKQKVARWLAENYLSTKTTEPNFSSQVWKGSYADLHLVFRNLESRDIAVEDVRNLMSAISLKPYYASGKVAIVNDAHRLSLAASNALLKTLEEPPDDTLLILITHAPHKLLSTILSRCQAVHFADLSEEDTRKVLKNLAAKIEFSPEAVNDLLALCQGSLEALHLSPFMNPHTLEVDNPAECRAHLETLHSSLAGLRKAIRAFLQGSPSAKGALDLSEMLTKTKETMWLSLSCLRYEVRSQLKTGNSKQAEKAATTLLSLLESERLIAERNANPQLQLSSVLVNYLAR